MWALQGAVLYFWLFLWSSYWLIRTWRKALNQISPSIYGHIHMLYTHQFLLHNNRTGNTTWTWESIIEIAYVVFAVCFLIRYKIIYCYNTTWGWIRKWNIINSFMLHKLQNICTVICVWSYINTQCIFWIWVTVIVNSKKMMVIIMWSVSSHQSSTSGKHRLPTLAVLDKFYWGGARWGQCLIRGAH